MNGIYARSNIAALHCLFAGEESVVKLATHALPCFCLIADKFKGLTFPQYFCRTPREWHNWTAKMKQK